jgi:hypothetical protein
MRWLVLLAVVLMLAPEMPDGVIQIQQQVSLQERQFEELYADLTFLRETVTDGIQRMDELAAVLRRDG